jgi:type VI secretion system protein
MVYDRLLIPNIAKMTAAEWFSTREQLRNDSPDGFEVHEWEVVPDTRIDVARLPFRGGGAALFVFANYKAPGDHRARLDKWSRPQILLQQRTFTVTDRL